MGILVRHFLRSLLNADAVAPGSDPRMPWVVLTAIAAFPAVPLFFYLTLFNADPIPGLSFYLALAMNLSGLVAGIAWKSLLPSRTDFLVLAPLPLSSLRIAAAHLTALMILVAGFAGAMSIIPGVLLPAASRTVTGHQLLARMGGEIAAAIAGAVWAFLAAMGLRAFAVAAFGEESWVCRMARFLLLTFLLAALGFSPALTAPENLRAIQQSDHWVMRPLQWFFALRACLSGSRDARTIALATQAVEALFLSGVAALLLYGLATAQAARGARAGARGGGRARRRFFIEARNRLEHWYLRDPEERAVFRFGAATLMRSGVHWACVSAWVGAGVALAAVQVAWALWQDSGTAPVQAAFFAAPLWLGFFTLVGLRHSFAIPVRPSGQLGLSAERNGSGRSTIVGLLEADGEFRRRTRGDRDAAPDSLGAWSGGCAPIRRHHRCVASVADRNSIAQLPQIALHLFLCGGQSQREISVAAVRDSLDGFLVERGHMGVRTSPPRWRRNCDRIGNRRGGRLAGSGASPSHAIARRVHVRRAGRHRGEVLDDADGMNASDRTRAGMGVCFASGRHSAVVSSNTVVVQTVTIMTKQSNEDTLPFIAYRLKEPSVTQRLTSASCRREWMDETFNGHANLCLPLLMANQSGWHLLNSHCIEAHWHGRQGVDSTHIRVLSGEGECPAKSHFGYGIITWRVPYLFRTPVGFNLLARGPANSPKDGVCPLEGLIEADSSVANFTINWKITRPGINIRFDEGEPICLLVPQRRNELERFAPSVVDIESEPELGQRYTTWSDSRKKIIEAMKNQTELQRQTSPLKAQLDYFHGRERAHDHPDNHQKKLNLRSF